MAKLRVDKIAAVGVSTETTGSVFFDGSGDHLAFTDSTDYDLGISNEAFSLEFWFYKLSAADTFAQLGLTRGGGTAAWNGSTGHSYLAHQNTDNKIYWQWWDGSDQREIVSTETPAINTWHHLAIQYDGTTTRGYLNGIEFGSATQGYAKPSSSNITRIGQDASGSTNCHAYISNLRVCKGHQVYTSDFTLPTRELDVHSESILLVCHDGENIFADKTGRHTGEISAIGDRLSSPTPTATDSPIGITTFQPGLTRDVDVTAGPVFQGGSGFTSQNWLTLPKGITEERFVEVANNAVSASSARGINGGGYIAPNNTNTMQYITIATTGNAADFGDLSAIRNVPGAVASSTRGIWMGGVSPSPSNTSLDVIDYVTIASTGNAADFGNLINNHRADSAAGNSTRGLRLGQQQSPAVGNTIEYITIASTGDAKDFGDLVQGRSQSGAFASPTRAVQFGGYGGPSVGNVNTIDYVTIQTMGNSIDFGDLKDGVRTGARGCSNATRGVFGGGYNPTPYASDLDYVTIASTGNSQDFGNLSMGNRYGSSCSSLTRGIFFIGESTSPTPGNRQNIDYVELATLANANDFGDLISSYSGYTAAACSNGHGGLG